MTIKQLKEIMHQLHLDYDAQPSLVYVFYQTDDGLVNNFSISVQHARQRNRQPMTAAQLADLMQREYPATRQARLLAVEHPQQGLTRWIDTADLCKQIHTTRRTLFRWRSQGLLHPSLMGNRLYYDLDEVEALLRSNVIQENGRADILGTPAPRPHFKQE